MRIGILSFRISGTDGVTLEIKKLGQVLEEMGHDVYFCAGELEDEVSSYRAPLMSFNHAKIEEIQEKAFGKEAAGNVEEEIDEMASRLKKKIEEFSCKYDIDFIFTQNVQSIPMNLPLGVAVGQFIEENSFPTIAHHHDFWWERERFQSSTAKDILQDYFPPKLDSSRDLVINSLAKNELSKRKGISANILPNIFDFSSSLVENDDFNENLREDLGLRECETLFLQPTRVVPRKGIERSVELISRLPDLTNQLFITHQAGDEGLSYLEELRRIAKRKEVKLRYLGDKFGNSRSESPDKQYSIWDAYLNADFVTFPSKKEGFGNALLETIYFQIPALVNRYPVYVHDIAPLGFDFVEMDDRITSSTVKSVKRILEYEEKRAKMVSKNFKLGKEYFSYERGKKILSKVINSL